MSLAERRDRDERFARAQSVDPAEYHAAVEAIWSNLNPQSTPRVKAESLAMSAMLAVEQVRHLRESGQDDEDERRETERRLAAAIRQREAERRAHLPEALR